ncbi:MAG: pyridoxal phosphate-dependent aminotransferase [Pseudomonadota bacterium]|nr:pyridoxal phosphate-dependent aminotransferase [Pseudomonadota bacterium]
MELSKRISNTKLSATIAMSMKARELKAKGAPIITLTAGEPDFDTPEHIKNAAIIAMKEGNTKYTPVDGMPALKDAIISKLKNDNNLEYSRDQIIVSTGCKQSIYNLCQSVLNEGDEVIVPAPYWVSYPEIIKLAGGVPVILETDKTKNFKLDSNKLEESINNRTKMIIINSPSNPSGVVYEKSDLESIGNILKKYPNILVASDDIYEHIILENKKFINILEVHPDLYERTVILNGVSKAYAMTGWRIGYTAGSREITNAMKKIQSQSTSCTCSISQSAAIAALSHKTDDLANMVKEYKKRSNFLIDAFKDINGFEFNSCEGSFYAFVDVSKAVEKTDNIKNDIDLCNFLLDRCNVAVVPGSAFGIENYIRISFATSMSNLEKAVENIKKEF